LMSAHHTQGFNCEEKTKKKMQVLRETNLRRRGKRWPSVTPLGMGLRTANDEKGVGAQAAQVGTSDHEQKTEVWQKMDGL